MEIGISVKIRLLETPEQTEALVRRLCGTGITGLTVHCRTTPMRPRERALREQLRMVADVCRETGVACLMNRDVEDRDQALQLIQEFAVDGAMIATKAEANSSCFRTRGRRTLPWREVTKEYIKTALEIENRWGNTKFLLGQLMPGKAREYKSVTGSRSYVEVCEILNLEGLVDRARRR
jgi:tRNA-dihydrouridine synthase 2